MKLKTELFPNIAVVIFLALGCAGGAVFAQDDGPPPPPDGSADDAFKDIREKLESSMISPSNYAGSMKNIVEGKMGTFCRKEIAYTVSWSSRVDEADAEISEEGVATAYLSLGRTSLKIGVWRKGGILCQWMGGTAEIDTDSTNIVFDLIPDLKTGGYPDVDLKRLKIGGLRMTNFDLHFPILGRIRGNAPDWANEFVEEKFNSIMEDILVSSLKTRLNASLTKQLAKMLDQEKKNRGQNRVNPASIPPIGGLN